MAHDDTVLEQAIGWTVRTGDPSFDDWESLATWLEADSSHADMYARVTADIADAAEALPPLPIAQNDDTPPVNHGRRRWMGGMVAAIAMVAGIGLWQMNTGTYAVETAPGERRAVALDDGGKIELAGGTRIILDRGNPRLARMERGQALFTIQHDETEPFRVLVGENELVDLGTIFDVKQTDRDLRLAVAEGLVAFNPQKQNVVVNPGRVLTSEAGSSAYRLDSVPVSQIGEWREGRLTFQNATLAEVAQDLTRATGAQFGTAPDAAPRRVSGSLLVEPLRADPSAAGPLLGVGMRRAGDVWVFEAP